MFLTVLVTTRSGCQYGGVKRVCAGFFFAAVVLGLSSCFLVSVPVKATGEIIEKSAHATGRAVNRGVQRATTPDGVPASDAYGEDDLVPPGATFDQYGYPE